MAEISIDALSENRDYTLIASFEDGFAAGWKMAVPEHFKEALDIKLTPRNFNKKTTMIWTQGKMYNFKSGDMLYDTKLAYQKWDEAMKHLKLCVQVKEAKPSFVSTYEVYEFVGKDLEVLKNNKFDQTVDRAKVNKQKIDHGFVKFEIYRPNEDRSGIDKIKEIECSQDDFVSFLQTGLLRNPENEFLDLINN